MMFRAIKHDSPSERKANANSRTARCFIEGQ